MIKQIFKIIWTERKINFWILLELIIAFSILWFCFDYLILMTKRTLEPSGFNTEHTYLIHIGSEEAEHNIWFLDYEEEEESEEAMTAALWNIFERIEQHPAIEAASMSYAAVPYSDSYWGSTYFVDSIEQSAQIKNVTSGYFDVFQIGSIHGRVFREEDETAGDLVVISGDREGLFAQQNPSQIDSLHSKKGTENYRVVGVVEKTKRMELEDYQANVYKLLQRGDPNVVYDAYFREVAVRVRPEADKDFIQTFVDEMEERLEIEPYFLSHITPLKERRKYYMNFTDFSSTLKSIYAISLFLIINVVLCIVGTFWFRVQSRRADIGLRIALGASRKSVQSIFVVEALLLLFLASLISLVLCFNINEVFLKDAGFGTGLRAYSFDYLTTFLVIAIITVLSVWYPAKKASDIPPVEALRSE